MTAEAPERIWAWDVAASGGLWYNSPSTRSYHNPTVEYTRADIAAADTRAAVRAVLAQVEQIALIHLEANIDPLSITDSAKRTMAHRLWSDIRALATTYAEAESKGEVE